MKISKALVYMACTLFFLTIIPASQAHVLLVANADGTTPQHEQIIKNTADALKSEGYQVLELYRENATTRNILKGMYNADSVIYAGHGVYIGGNYDGNGGPATPPFGMGAADGIIWGYQDKMKEGLMGRTYEAPFKGNIPVILFGVCFSSGWVEDKEVANPTESVASFSQMFTSHKANYYATPYIKRFEGRDVVDIVAVFLGGASSLGDANRKNYRYTIHRETVHENQQIWRDEHGYNAFVGNWNGTFPRADQTTPYNDIEAEEWYNGGLTAPAGQLEEATMDHLNQSLENLIHDFLSRLYSIIYGIWDRNVPEINITHKFGD